MSRDDRLEIAITVVVRNVGVKIHTLRKQGVTIPHQLSWVEVGVGKGMQSE